MVEAKPLAPGRGKYDRTLSKQERRLEQRVRLFEATGDVVAARGYAGATVARICEAAGMSRRTFYEHFGDLRSAVLELHDYAANATFSAVVAQVETTDDMVLKLQVGVRAFLGAIADNAAMARVLFREIRAVGPQFEARREQQIQRYVEMISAQVQTAYDAGVAKRPPNELVIFALVAAMEAVAMRYVHRNEAEKAGEAVEALVDLVLGVFL